MNRISQRSQVNIVGERELHRHSLCPNRVTMVLKGEMVCEKDSTRAFEGQGNKACPDPKSRPDLRVPN